MERGSKRTPGKPEDFTVRQYRGSVPIPLSQAFPELNSPADTRLEPFFSYLREIDAAREAGLARVALQAALTLPDVLGAIDNPSLAGPRNVGRRFKAWYENVKHEGFSVMHWSADSAYKLRNTGLHSLNLDDTQFFDHFPREVKQYIRLFGNFVGTVQSLPMNKEAELMFRGKLDRHMYMTQTALGETVLFHINPDLFVAEILRAAIDWAASDKIDTKALDQLSKVFSLINSCPMADANLVARLASTA